MAEMATANHIRVVFCSVTPAFDFPWRAGLAPGAEGGGAECLDQGLCRRKGHVYVDYHSAMKDERGGLPATLSADGVHPLPAGTPSWLRWWRRGSRRR